MCVCIYVIYIVVSSLYPVSHVCDLYLSPLYVTYIYDCIVAGPIAAFLIGKMGVQLVAVIAVLVHISGFLASAFATSWWHVIPSFAVLCGKKNSFLM